jgi:hypothetical protein
VFPLLHRCIDGGQMMVSGGNLAFADLPRF